MGRVLSLKPSYYDALKRLTLEVSGVHLGHDHTFLIESRLAPLARQEGFDSLNAMIDELFSRGDNRLAINVVTSLLQREQRFFNDPTTLKELSGTILPHLYKIQKDQKISLLSYGCGGGHEVYSLAILVEHLKDKYPELSVNITGVDYPCQALERAKIGKFSHFDVQRGLPIRDLVSFFNKDDENWVVKESLRQKVKFKEFHLLSNSKALGQFDIVLFRGKMLHYSAPAQVRILRGLSMLVKPERYMILGENEGIKDINYGFDPVDSCLHSYRKHPEKIIEAVIEETGKKPSERTTFIASEPEKSSQKNNKKTKTVILNPLEVKEAQQRKAVKKAAERQALKEKLAARQQALKTNLRTQKK